MKFVFALSGFLATTALAGPIITRQSANNSTSTNNDTSILQYALTLEHLEDAFYRDALKNLTEQDFINAGYSAAYYNNLKYIASDEKSHVQLLSSALTSAGQTPAAECQYKFPYTDVRSFVTLSSVLEGVGTSAYLGGAPLITSKQYLTVAGSILVTEALHTSLQRSAVGEVPMANPYGTPLDPNSVYTLASMFITSCPAGNPQLPFVAFPSLTYVSNAGYCEQQNCAPSAQIKKRQNQWNAWSSNESNEPNNTCSENYTNVAAMISAPLPDISTPPASVGDTITLAATSVIPVGSWVTFVSGLSVVSVQGVIDCNEISAKIPAIALGQTYVFVSTNDQEGTLNGANVLFGPTVVEVNPAPAAI